MTSDPNMRWDGEQWQRWNGERWIPQGVSAPVQQASPRTAQAGYPPAAGPVVAPTQGAVARTGSANLAHVTIAWILAVLTIGYLLPWAIAASRGKSNAGAIGILNLLLGWTVVGWIVALVMACGAEPGGAGGQQVTVVNTLAVNNGQPYPQAQPNYPQPYAASAPEYPAPTQAYQPQSVEPQMNRYAPPAVDAGRAWDAPPAASQQPGSAPSVRPYDAIEARPSEPLD